MIAGASQDRQVERHMQFWFTGPCDPADHLQHKSIIGSFVRLLQQQALCGEAARGQHTSNACNLSDFTVHCGTTGDRRRKREAPNNVSIHMKLKASAR